MIHVDALWNYVFFRALEEPQYTFSEDEFVCGDSS